MRSKYTTDCFNGSHKISEKCRAVGKLKFKTKKTSSKATGGLAMRKARIFNYYNKRPTHV